MIPKWMRDHAPGVALAIGSVAKPAYRSERRTARGHLVVPPTMRPAPRVPGSVWAVTMMHNEEDVAEHVVLHMLEQGVDAVVVADNMSDDRTPDILASLAARLPVHVVRDTWSAHAQGTKMTLVAALARSCGADWVIPFDADELWFADGCSVSAFLRATSADIVTASIHNVFPSVDDDESERDPFFRLTRFDVTPARVQKVAIRPHRVFKLSEGNLDVNMGGARSAGLYIAHFPFRSFEQMAAKLRHGRKALAETRFSVDTGSHWRIAGAWDDERLHDVYRGLQEGRPLEHMSWSPVGPFECLHPGGWSSWRAECRPAA